MDILEDTKFILIVYIIKDSEKTLGRGVAFGG